MEAAEIRAALAPLLRVAFQQGVGSRPRRYLPQDEVLERLSALAAEPAVSDPEAATGWRVVEGRRWLLNRRLDGRSVPLVQREQTAIVARGWPEARDLARLLNWGDVLAPGPR